VIEIMDCIVRFSPNPTPMLLLLGVAPRALHRLAASVGMH